MVYLHSYFNRKSEASAKLLIQKKALKKNNMLCIKDFIDKKINNPEKANKLLTFIDDVQRRSNQGISFTAEEIKEKQKNLEDLGFGETAAQNFFQDLTTLAQHRNTFFSQTKWNWFGLNRTDGIIQVRKFLEAHKAFVLQEERNTPPLQQEAPIQKPIRKHNLGRQMSNAAQKHSFPVLFPFSDSSLGSVAESERSNSSADSTDSTSGQNVAPKIVTPWAEKNHMKCEKERQRKQQEEQKELMYSPADSSYFDLELDKNNITPQNLSPSVEHSLLHERVCNHPNPQENV